MSMTLNEFRASREWSDNLGKFFADMRWDDEPTPAKGWVYLGALYIEEVAPHWPNETRKAGKWHLLISNCSLVTDNLTKLEERLYEFALSEGFELPRNREAHHE